MNKRIFSFDLSGELVLGFDTGLDVQAFARAKMFQLISQTGSIVYPDGRIEAWQPGGVTELIPPDSNSESASTMIIWGSFFPGENLIEVISSNKKNEALDALRSWLKARISLEENLTAENIVDKNSIEVKDTNFGSPTGAFIISRESNYTNQFPAGTVFFPPARLVKRCLEAGGNSLAQGEKLPENDALLEAERWVHPDRQGLDAISFSAAAMLYRIFCNTVPFLNNSTDELRQDIREAVFLPPNLAAPGLDTQMAEIISSSLKSKTEIPKPLDIFNFIGPPASREFTSWFKTLNEEEISKIKTEQEQYSKKKALAVKTKRFVVRNTVIITISVIALIIILFSIRATIRRRSELPTTKGMNPIEVAQAYYGAFGDLDHTLMEACVTGKAGKDDIARVMNVFVISKVRQAYEIGQEPFVSAQEWIDSGMYSEDISDTEKIIFGITDLELSGFMENSESASLIANYILWIPEAIVVKDRLEFKFQKGAWRIAEINRESSQ